MSYNDTYWGYIPYQSETTDANKQTEGDMKEGFYITPRQSQHRQNQWPDESKLPQFRDVIDNYMKEMDKIAIQIMELIALSFNLSVNYFKHPGIRDNADDLLYLLHYPKKKKSDIDAGLFGTGAHSDYDLFTILLTDHNRGLQILYENKFIDIEYKENAFVVNIADTLEKWTNDIFKSAIHRVVINDGLNDRYSIPYFVAANHDLIIDCLPNTVLPNNEKYANCNHEPFKSGDYLNYKLQQTIVNYQLETHQDNVDEGIPLIQSCESFSFFALPMIVR